MNEILSNISSLFYFIFTCLIVIIIISLLAAFTLKKFNPEKGKLKIYGMFLGLTKKDILAISLLTIRYILFIWCLFTKDLSILYFLGFLIPGILYNILYQRIFNGIFDIISSIIIFVGLYSKNIFWNYLIEIQSVWYVVVILIILTVFILLYYSYFFLKDLDFVIKKNNYIAKKYQKNKEDRK